MVGIYDVITSCNYCGCENNEIEEVLDTRYGEVAVARTHCKDCGKHDVWDMGFFMTETGFDGKCRKQ